MEIQHVRRAQQIWKKARRLALLVVKRDTYRRAALAGASAGAGERGAKSYLGRSSSLEGRLYAMMGEGKEDGELLFPCSAQQKIDGRGFEIGRDEAGFSSSERVQ